VRRLPERNKVNEAAVPVQYAIYVIFVNPLALRHHVRGSLGV
jgi:hypothetical protein